MGRPKTSTTSIQETLACNRDKLDKQGIYYPNFISEPGWKYINHSFPIKNIFMDNPENYHWNIKKLLTNDNILKNKQKFKNILLGYSKIKKNIIISGEGIITLSENEMLKLKKF